MSIQALTFAMALRGVSSSEKLLLLALANYADENLKCYPSQRRLADDTSLSDRTIRTLLSDLEGRGLLTRMPRLRGDGSRASDVVTLNITGAAEVTSGGAETISGGVRKQVPGGAEVTSALTTFEPSINQDSGAKAPSTRECDGFEDWYGGYPHKIGKSAAAKAFLTARKAASLDDLLTGLDRYIRTKPPDRSWCNPATWLNQQRWLDEPAPEPRNVQRSDPKFTARQANLDADFAGSEIAAEQWRREHGHS